MIATLILATAIGLAAPAMDTIPGSPDTPTVPIDSGQMTAVIAAGGPDVEAMCASYGPLADVTFQLNATLGGGADSLATLTQLVDAYEVVALEGDSLRLTPEARDVYLDWLHEDCVA